MERPWGLHQVHISMEVLITEINIESLKLGYLLRQGDRLDGLPRLGLDFGFDDLLKVG